MGDDIQVGPASPGLRISQALSQLLAIIYWLLETHPSRQPYMAAWALTLGQAVALVIRSGN